MDSYLDKPLAAYLADAADKTPTPGGGSVAALAGALATTMASMAANFTTGKEKYRGVEPQIVRDLKSLEEARRKFLDLMHRDMEAYQTVREAYRLPKESAPEQAAREAAIQAALGQSLLVPRKAAKVAIEVLEIIDELAGIANANLLSDVAVAAILAEATHEASCVNVEVNLKACTDQPAVAGTRRELEDGRRLAVMLKERSLEAVRARSGE